MKDDDITEIIIGCSFEVHNKLGSGFLEKVYENALRIELTKKGLKVLQQEPIKVWYENEIIGDYLADLWVADRIIVELKAIQSLNKESELQLVNQPKLTQACSSTSVLRYRSGANTGNTSLPNRTKQS